MIKFEKVSRFADADFNLPVRKTKNSAGYDFEVAEDIIIPTWTSHLIELGKVNTTVTEPPVPLDILASWTKATKAKPTLVSTGVKCHLEEGYYLELSVRSSTPLKYWIILANSVGIIDADYCDNPDNEGEIFFQVINLSPYPIQLRKGDIIGQGIIKRYEITDDDKAVGERQGGFGSTSSVGINSPMVITPIAIQDGAISPVGMRRYTSAIEDACGMRKEDIINSIQKAITDYSFEVGV